MTRIVTLLLTHEPADAVERMVDCWAGHGAEAVVVAFGGEKAGFERVSHPRKCWVDDPELRTSDHPRERQSYLGVFRAALPSLEETGASHVHFAEYDEVPLAPWPGANLLESMRAEDADVMGHNLRRVDGSSHPHWLNHIKDAWFMDYWRGVSRRDDHGVVLSMLGCGSFWRLEAFREVSAMRPPHRVYLELFLPTAAHHLGYRVRGIGEQDRFVQPHQPKTREMLDGMRRDGAWVAHPVKGIWNK